jgi:hypothetical protein
VKTVAGLYPGDSEVQPVTTMLEKVLTEEMPQPAEDARLASTVALGSTTSPGAGTPEAAPPAPVPATPPVEAPPSATSPSRAPDAAVVEHPPKPPAKVAQPIWARLRSQLPQIAINRNTILGVAAILVLSFATVMSLFLGRLAHRPTKAASGVVTVPVEVVTSPPGALIQIDGQDRGTSKLNLNLSPGVHHLRATLDGYRPAFFDIPAKAGSSVPVNLTLQPLPLLVHLTSDLEGGQVLLDEQPAGSVENGEFTLNEVPPGKHTIKFAGRGGGADVAFSSNPADVPGLSGPFAAKELIAVVAGSFRGTVRVQCTCGPANILLDNKPPAATGPDGAEWSGIAPGLHDLAVGEGDKARKVVLEVGTVPALNVFLKADRNVGILVVSAGEDDVTILLNGKPYRLHTSKGRLRLNLAPQTYSVGVAKDGFETPPEQHVEIRKGAESSLAFALKPVVRMSTLQLEGALDGTQILVDGNSVGSAQPDGGFSASVAPGKHSIDLRKSGYVSKHFEREFPAGQAVTFSASETALQPVTGTLRITLATPGATVTLRKKGDESSPGRTLNEPEVSLPEGPYVLSASAPNHSDFREEVAIVAGQVKIVEIRLKPLPQPDRRPPVPTGLQAWTDPAGWVAEGGWLFRQGGNFVPFKMSPTAGQYHFAVFLRSKRAQWVLNRVDDRNYLVFEIDKKNFYRRLVSNGKAGGQVKVPHGAGEAGTYVIQVEVSSQAIVHNIQKGGKWQQLDEWRQPGRDLATGVFGFLIPGREEIGISNFSFQPR